jgi:hypothetical protein
MNKKNTTADIFGIMDIVLGLWHGLAALLMIGVLVYGVFFSGDTEQEIMEGVIGFSPDDGEEAQNKDIWMLY